MSFLLSIYEGVGFLSPMGLCLTIGRTVEESSPGFVISHSYNQYSKSPNAPVPCQHLLLFVFCCGRVSPLSDLLNTALSLKYSHFILILNSKHFLSLPFHHLSPGCCNSSSSGFWDATSLHSGPLLLIRFSLPTSCRQSFTMFFLRGQCNKKKGGRGARNISRKKDPAEGIWLYKGFIVTPINQQISERVPSFSLLFPSSPHLPSLLSHPPEHSHFLSQLHKNCIMAFANTLLYNLKKLSYSDTIFTTTLDVSKAGIY